MNRESLVDAVAFKVKKDLENITSEGTEGENLIKVESKDGIGANIPHGNTKLNNEEESPTKEKTAANTTEAN